MSHSQTKEQEEEETMLTKEQRTEVIDGLVSNCDCWKGEGDKEVLEGFKDEKLEALKTQADRAEADAIIANAAKAGFVDPNSNTLYRLGLDDKGQPKVERKVKPVTNKDPDDDDEEDEEEEEESMTKKKKFPFRFKKKGKFPYKKTENERPTFDELLEEDPERAAVFNYGLEQMQKERRQIISRLVQNSPTAKAKEAAAKVYEDMDIGELRTIADALPKQKVQNESVPLFYGAGGVPDVDYGQEEADDGMLVQNMDWKGIVAAQRQQDAARG